MKLKDLLDVIRVYERIEINIHDYDTGIVFPLFDGIVFDFYVSPVAQTKWSSYYNKEVDVVESYYDDEYDDSFILITLKLATK